MQKLGVEKIEFDFNANQVVISCSGGKKLNVSDSSSNLTKTQQQALIKRFKSESSPITFSQVKSDLEKGNKGKSGNGGIIAAIVIVGLVLAVIIGVVIHKNKK